MIHSLVDDREAIHIRKQISDHSAHFEIKVADGDVGKLLGRRGIYANSIRRLWEAAYGKTGRGFHLHIVDPRREREHRSS
tara:strand:+ start:1542 stop:1781 length:240 start_codon:yes stop_codon:yes gene_type:complete